MARKLRVCFEGAIYHVTMRGVERRPIFRDTADKERFVARLGEGVEEFGVRLYLFVLMSNHVHLVVETPKANLSAFMHNLQTAYTVYYNRRHRRAGHLMQGRYAAVLVQGDSYLLKLSRYIHLNPVFVGEVRRQGLGVRVRCLRDYPWSSYRGYVGEGKPYEFVDEAPVLALSEAPEKKRRGAYRRFVEAGIAETDSGFKDLLKGAGWGIGDDDFQERIRDRHTDLTGKVRRKEDVSFRRVAPDAGVVAVLAAVASEFGLDVGELKKRQYRCVARPVAALMLCRHSGLNQRDAASCLGMGSGAAACHQLKTLRARLARDGELAARVARITASIEGTKERHRDAENLICKGCPR